MSKRSFLFGTLVLLAGLASATPSRAGSVLTTSISFTKATPGLMSIELTYDTPANTLSALSPVLTGAPGGTTPSSTLDMATSVVTVTFPGTTGQGPFAYTFTLTDSLNTPASLTPSFTPSNSSLTDFSFSVTQGVPEPASIALLGIGMTGFLAFRRFRKKASAA
jgi:hypothetical protein